MKHLNDFDNFDWKQLDEHEFPFQEDAWKDMERRINATESPFDFLKNIQLFLGLVSVFYFFVIIALLYTVFTKPDINTTSTLNDTNQQIGLWPAFFNTNSEKTDDDVSLLWNMTQAGSYFDTPTPFLISENKGLKTALLSNNFNLTKRLDHFNSLSSPDKVYVHTDRVLYSPGDDIWFKAYVRDAGSLTASTMSDVVHVELLSPSGKAVFNRKLVALEGSAKGDFRLDKNLPGGVYTLKAYTNWQRNFNDYFEKKIQIQQPVIPKLAMQLDFERKAYGPGEEVTAKLQVNTPDNQPLKLNSFRYKIDINGKELSSKKAATDKAGHAAVKFILPEELNTTDGLLNVLIDYKGSTASIARAVPIVLNKIDLQFFPEGGELLADIPVRTAFKALNEFGKPADVEGAIYNKKGEQVTVFQSYHLGMGLVEFTPKAGEQYTAKITKPSISETYSLPVAQKQGYSLKIKNQKPASLDVEVLSTRKQKLTLIGQSRGRIYWEENFKAVPGVNNFKVATAKFPTGIIQWTLLNEDEVELAERLVFVNRQKTLNVSIKTDKQQYKPREKVKMTITVKDENGKPAAGNFSLSVVDDNLVTFADDKQSNVIAYMLLESELKGTIEEPNFYFEKDNQKAGQALDLLMMTQGWRKFEWKNINVSPEVAIQHANERAVVAGTILNNDGNPIPRALVRVSNSTLRTRTDDNGYFEFEGVNLSKNTWLRIQKDDYPENWAQVRQYSSNLKFKISEHASKAIDLSPYAGNFSPYSRSYLEMIPAQYEVVTEQVQLVPAASHILAIPPEFETKEEKILIREARENEEAVYDIVEQQVLKTPATYREVEIPAQYETITKKVLKTPATTRQREYQIAAEYRTITKRLLVEDTQTRTRADGKLEVVPASYETVVELVEKNTPASNPLTYTWGETPENTAANVFDLLKPGNFSATGTSTKDKLNTSLDKDNPSYKIYYLAKTKSEKINDTKVPAKYITQVRKVMKQAPKAEKTEVPAEYTHVEKRVKNKAGDYETKIEKIEIKPKHFIYEVTQAEYEESEEKIKVSSPHDGIEVLPAEYTVQSKYVEREAEKGLEINGYYRARTFYAPKYEKPVQTKERNDFRPTVYWNTNVNVGKDGKKTLEFYNSDAMTTFRAILEGFSSNGNVGCSTHKYFTQMPLGMDVKVPAGVLVGDKVAIPLTISNNSSDEIKGKLSIKAPKNFKALESIENEHTIAANSARTILLEYEALSEAQGTFSIGFDAGEFKDQFKTEIATYQRGFPVRQMYSGNDLEKSFDLSINKPTSGSPIQAVLTAYPNVLGEIMTGLDRMMRQPTGCFEQVSSANYPNILVLNYMLDNNDVDTDLQKTANTYLTEGYKKLTGYEVEGGGFDWYGKAPAHEGLTAYGLMQFKDMQSVFSVDQEMISRNADWLLSRKNGEGGWKVNKKHLHNWSETEVTNAYINWALSEAGYSDKISDEIEHTYEAALESGDPYMLALLSNTLSIKEDDRYTIINEELLKLQKNDGSWQGNSHSVVYSKGKNLQIETTALAAIALMNTGQIDNINRAIKFLSLAKSSTGFGSTQATVLAMKALSQYSKINQSIRTAGTFTVYINDKKVGTQTYTATENEAITFSKIGKHLSAGKQKLDVKFEDTSSPLAFDLAINYSTDMPDNHPACKVKLHTTLSEAETQVGETVRLSATLNNITNNSLPATVALVGIPSGLSLQNFQLEALSDQNRFDYYEIWDGYLVLHYRQLEADAERTIILDLKADIPGKYESPASYAYLYYANDMKHWAKPNSISIAN